MSEGAEHARELDEILRDIEGGLEVLEARDRELNPDFDLEGRTGEEITLLLRGAGAIRRGTGKLPASFWELPMPEDPKGSVRRALEEDRR